MSKHRWVKIFDVICEYSVYGLILSIPISSAAIESFFGLAFLSFLFKKILKPEFKFLKTKQHLFLLLFVVFCVLSLFNSGQYLRKSLGALFVKWLEYISISLIISDILSSRLRLRNATGILLLVSFVIGIDGLSQRFFGVEFLWHRPTIKIVGGLTCITGPFHHYNSFGSYVACILSLVAALLFLPVSKIIYRASLSVVLALLSLCLIFTFSRGAFIGLMSSLLLMLLIARRFKVLFYIIGIVLISLFVVPGFRARLEFIFQPGGDTARFVMWRGAWNMIRENPFLGKGLGTFMDYFPRYVKGLGAQYAHNCFLQIWAETGIFSLLSFLLFISSILYKSINAFIKSEDFLLLGISCAIFGFLVHSLFDTHLYSLQLAVLFWTLLGILAAQNSLACRSRCNSR